MCNVFKVAYKCLRFVFSHLYSQLCYVFISIKILDCIIHKVSFWQMKCNSASYFWRKKCISFKMKSRKLLFFSSSLLFELIEGQSQKLDSVCLFFYVFFPRLLPSNLWSFNSNLLDTHILSHMMKGERVKDREKDMEALIVCPGSSEGL